MEQQAGAVNQWGKVMNDTGTFGHTCGEKGIGI